MGFSRDNRSGSSELIFRGSNFLRFMSGLWVTVRISLPSVGLSVALGLIVGIVMTLKNPIARLVTRAYLEFVRTMPQLVLLFLVYFGLTRAFGWNLSVNVSAVVVFTVWGTAELPYMKVALGVVSPDSAVITSVEELSGKTLIVCKGATAETFFQENFTDVKLQKYDQYTDAYNALLDGRGGAFSTDNTGALAWALLNPGFTVGIESLGDLDTIAPAVQKGNITLLDWLNERL